MSDGAPEDELVVYSDYVCPFCYLGKRSLERYLESAEDPPRVRWKPFDLRLHKRREDGTIDHDVQDGKDEAYYQRAKANVQRLAQDYDVEMTLDLPEGVDSRPAHLVALHLEDHAQPEAQAAFHDAVFRALWVQGRDIGDVDVLEAILREVDLDPTLAASALDDEALADELDARFRQAHRAGVTGVPTFAKGQLAIPGAVPPEHIEKLVENA